IVMRHNDFGNLSTARRPPPPPPPSRPALPAASSAREARLPLLTLPEFRHAAPVEECDQIFGLLRRRHHDLRPPPRDQRDEAESVAARSRQGPLPDVPRPVLELVRPRPGRESFADQASEQGP